MSLVDIYPTLLDAAGAEPPSYPLHGTSLLPLAQGESPAWRDAVACEFLGLGNIPMNLRTLRSGDFKYGYNMSWPEELYNLHEDPDEMNNLAEDPACADLLRRFRLRLEQWMVETDDPSLRMFRWHQGISGEFQSN